MPPRRRSRLGQISLVVIGGIVVLVLGLVTTAALRSSGEGAGPGRQPDRFSVRKGAFDITIPVTGELAAARQIDIRNMLDGRAIITEIVPEGTFVQQGDVLLKLNDDELRNKARDAEDGVNTAKTAVEVAENKLNITKKTRESDVAKAALAIELAKLALQAWQEGEDVSKRKELDLAIETADKEYDRLQKRYEDSQGLRKQDFISEDELKRDEIAMIQARAKIQQARLDKEVYEKYVFEQNRATKQSDVDQAMAEHDRVVTNSDAEVQTAQSELDSKKYQLESARVKHSDLLEQLGFCTVRATSAGLVVYYSSTQTGGMGRNGRVLSASLHSNDAAINGHHHHHLLPQPNNVLGRQGGPGCAHFQHGRGFVHFGHNALVRIFPLLVAEKRQRLSDQNVNNSRRR